MLSVGYSVIFLCVPMISKNLDSYLIIVLGTSGAREIPAYRAVLGPRHVARGCPGRGVPGECGNGPPPGRARVTVGAGCKCLGRDGKCLEASRREK